MARPQSAAKAGFYPTPPEALDDIASVLSPRITFGTSADSDEYRLLDPCCGDGIPLETLATTLSKPALPPVNTFGVELSLERASVSSTRIHHVMHADLFHTSIANDTFGLLFLNPPYDTQESEDRPERIRSELAFLQRCTQYLSRQSGVLVLVVQRKFLDERAVRFLANHYHNIVCLDFPPTEIERFDQITIFGYRKSEPYLDLKAEEYLRHWPKSHDRTPPQNLEYTVPALPKKQVYFHNSYHDPWQAAQEAQTAGIWTTQEFQDILHPPHTSRTRPLVPLRQGHIALLTAAGFLDDKELTDTDGTKVLVKGNIEKKTVTTEASSERHTQQERLEITITALNLHTGEFHDIKP